MMSAWGARGRFDESALHDVLDAAQRLGFIGARPVSEAIEHSRAVVAGLVDTVGSVVDLGAGGGLPGLVVALDRPDLRLTLVDRRAKRTDFLERMIRRHDLVSRVDVVASDVELLARAIGSGAASPFDGAIARGFGPPAQTLRLMASVVRPGGRLVITEPPDGDRWNPELLASHGVVRCSSPAGVAVFERAGGFT